MRRVISKLAKTNFRKISETAKKENEVKILLYDFIINNIYIYRFDIAGFIANFIILLLLKSK